jgi:GDP-L-fucose synthase
VARDGGLLNQSAPIIYPLAGKRVWVAGHRGMVGAALLRRLQREGCELLTVGRDAVDLRNPAQVGDWMAQSRPDAIFLAAAKVGGILANDSYPADFLYDNLMIQANVVEAARRGGVGKVLLLGSSCIYPKLAPIPIQEDALLSGPLEPTNQWYAIAKIAGVKLGQAYRRQHGLDVISAMPTNLYGPGDNFDLNASHVLPALIRKAHEAKRSGARQFVIWGSGAPLREFLHVGDCADALVHLMQVYSDEEHVNVGSGEDIAIYDLARMVAEVVGFDGEIVRDLSKPDGTPRKLMSADKLHGLGWRATTPLRTGLEQVYAWYLANEGERSGA